MHIEPPPVYPGINVLTENLEVYVLSEMQELRARANEEYLYWQKFRYRKFPAGVDAQLAWQLLKANRELVAVRLQLPSLPTLHFVPTDALSERFHRLDQQIGGLVGFDEEFDAKDRQRFVKNALMEEAIASSQLEGASIERERAKAMLRSKRAPRDQSERMIANNYAAMRFVAEDLTRDIDEAYVLELHAIATLGTLPDPTWEGAFRSGGNVVVDQLSGEIVHEAPPRAQLGALMADVYTLIARKDYRPFVHPVARASIIHFLIGYIHPFEDGNGRTARALMYAYLLRHGYWLTEYLVISKAIASSRASYDKAYLYTEHDGLDATYFVQYQTRAMLKAGEQFEEYLNRQLRKQKRARRLSVEEGLNARQVALMERLASNPLQFVTVAEQQGEHEIAQPTARRDLEDLVSREVLSRKRVGRQLVYRKV